MDNASDYWQRRYYEALEGFNVDERRWHRVDALLRRLVQRLLLVANGRGERLDAIIGQVRDAVVADGDEQILTQVISDLSDAIMELDPTHQIKAFRGDDDAAETTPQSSVGSLLAHLLDRLALTPDLAERAGKLRAAIDTAAFADMIGHTEQIATLVNRQCALLVADKARVDALLHHVAEHIGELERYLHGQSDQLDAGKQSRQELDAHMQATVQQMHLDIDQADQLDTLQQQVQAHLSGIGSSLDSFHRREDARELLWLERTQGMSARIRELEATSKELERSLHEHKKQALTDRLTGIANRVAFEERIAEACRRFKRSALPAGLLVLDIDRFKTINDRFGHSAGDRALRVVAQQLRAQLRMTDFLARYGGEEFVIVLEAVNADDALLVAEKLRSHIAELKFHVRGQPVQITLSAGVTALQADDTPEAAFDRADRALYQAKRDGRNTSAAA